MAEDESVLLSATGNPAEGPLETFLGEPFVPNRPVQGAPGSDQIYLLFESGEKFYAEAMQVARFNLSWILEGELTGNGEVPDWTQ